MAALLVAQERCQMALELLVRAGAEAGLRAKWALPPCGRCRPPQTAWR